MADKSTVLTIPVEVVDIRPRADRQKKRENHHMSNTPEYRSYNMMLNRCLNPHAMDYRHYGGRGIIVCERWRNSFTAFYEDMGLRLAGLTLDRKDNNGNYDPENCRWATKQQQSRNRRDSRKILYKGILVNLHNAADRFGQNADTVRSRIDRLGWKPEDALHGFR